MKFDELANQYAALPQLQPANYQPQQCINLQAARREEERGRVETWRQEMQAWRNEQQAQQEPQQDEEAEERQRWNQDRELLQRQLRLEELANNRSREHIEEYHRHSPSPPLSLPPSLPPSRSPSPPPPPPALALALPPPQPQVPQHNRPLPRGLVPYHEPQQRHSLGLMNFECSQCHALHFISEKLSKSSNNEPKFGMCCLRGQVDLPPLHPAPRELADLFIGRSPHSLDFKTNIRQYNGAFGFTSLGANIDRSVTGASGPYSFRISGELRHLSGALLPLGDNPPVFAQIYIYDPAQQLAQRQANNTNLNPAVMAIIQGVIHESHPYIALYRQAFEIMRDKLLGDALSSSLRGIVV